MAPGPALGPAGSNHAHMANSDATTDSCGPVRVASAIDACVATARLGVDHSAGSVTRAVARSFRVPSWPTAVHLRAVPAPPCARLPARHLRAEPSWYPDVPARVP